MSALLAAALLLLTPASAASEMEVYKSVYDEITLVPSTHPWAGGYHGLAGIGGADSIYLAPSGRYCFVARYDISPFEDPRCGTFKVEGGRVVRGDGKIRPYFGPPWVFVPWGERRYLVPEERLLDFVNAVNQGHEPGYGRLGGSGAAYLRDGGDDVFVAGSPEVPERYRGFLLRKPVAAKAVEVGQRKHSIKREGRHEEEECKTPVRFDQGSDVGVFVGMELLADVEDTPKAVIQKVSHSSSEGTIEQRDCDRYDAVPQGTVFTSAPPWRKNVVLSTEPLSLELRYASGERRPAFGEGHPHRVFFPESVLPASSGRGFVWHPVADLTVRTSVHGVLELGSSEKLIARAILSAGGNAYVESDEKGLSERLGAAEARLLCVYRVEFEGRPLDPASTVFIKEDDWERTIAGARLATCLCSRAAMDARKAAVLRLLKWEEAMLARAHEVRFEELSGERKEAVESLVPADRRRGRVWPALYWDKHQSQFSMDVFGAGFDAEFSCEKDGSPDAADCRRQHDLYYR